VTSLDVADLVVITGRVLGIKPGAALEQIDAQAAETALAETPAPLTLPDSYAAAAACARLIRGLLRHPPFPGHRERVAVAAGLQFLAVNGWQADLDPPQAAATVVRCLASGRIEPDDMAGWLAARLSAPAARRIRMPHVSNKEAIVRAPRIHGRARRPGGGAGMSVDGRMLARFSDHAAAAVFMARQEARRLGHGSVDPEHLLLGLLRVGEGTGISALDTLDVSREALRQQLEESIGHGPGRTDGPVRFSRPRGQKVLNSALPEALAHGTDICTADLLLAQYHDDGPASRTLARLGATEDRVRDTVAALRAQSRGRQVTRRARTARV
jgi:prophage maintenance system killer protein